MKTILMSIQSKWLAKILNGEKTVELRKRFPKDYRGWVYLYCTKGKPYLTKIYGEWCLTRYGCEESQSGNVRTVNGKVAFRFWVDNVEEIVLEDISGNEQYNIVFENHTAKETEDKLKSMCLTFDEFLDYHLKSLTHKKDGYVVSKAIHISKLEIFDKPKELGEFKTAVHYPKNIIQIYLDYKPLTKAPQSWQYVEVEQ